MVLGTSTGATRGLNIRTHLYVGGVDVGVIAEEEDDGDVDNLDNLDNDIDDCEEGEGESRGGS